MRLFSVSDNAKQYKFKKHPADKGDKVIMYKDKSVCVVVPAFNEATQIGQVIGSMPDFIDRIVIIDDASQDETPEVIQRIGKENTKNSFHPASDQSRRGRCHCKRVQMGPR